MSHLRTAQRALELRVLGGLHLACDGEKVDVPANARQLLAFLAIARGSGQRMHVAGSLWPEIIEERALGRLRTGLWQLGRTGLTVVEQDRRSLRLASSVQVDVHEATDIGHRIISSPQQASLADCRCRHLQRDVLPGWYDDWLVVAREQFLDLRLHALEVACERLAKLGCHGEATQTGLAAVAADPLRESSRRSLIRAYAAERNLVAAVRQFERYRVLIKDELGVEPSEQMLSLIRSVYSGAGSRREIAS
jgi:DNA-binding SARP family transcriptional activator